MNINELYDSHKIENHDRLKRVNSILLILPEKDFDYSSVLTILGVDKFEVSYTYPKTESSDFTIQEVQCFQPILVVSIGKALSDDYPLYISEDGKECSSGLKEEVKEAVSPNWFVNLHHHDDFSVRDGLGTVQDLLDLQKARGNKFCVVTNHGNLGGWIRQYSACKKAGVKCVFGVESYVNDFRGTEEVGEIETLKERIKEVVEKKKELKTPTFEKITKPKKSNKVKISKEERADLSKEELGKRNLEVELENKKLEDEHQKLLSEYECITQDRKKQKDDVKKKKDDLIEQEKNLREELKKTAEEYKAVLKENRKNHHLVLLAKNEEGFFNIIKLSNDANINGFYHKPRMTHEALKQWGSGIVALSACYAGEISSLLLEDKYEEAKELYGFYKDCFDEFYIEMTMVEMPEQVELNKKLLLFAQDVGAKIILSCDSHYILKEHAETHDLLLLIRDKKTVLDARERPEEVWQFEARNLFHRSYIEMRELWDDGFVTSEGKHYVYKDDVFTEDVFEEACLNTRRIVLSCDNINLDSSLKLPVLYDDGPSMLRKKAQEGFRERGLRGKEYMDRLNHELDIIISKGYADYFLTMDKIIRDTIENHGINSIGWGRGCFHPDMVVLMGDGSRKRISEVKVGDVVISHDGSRQVVLNVFEYEVDEDLYWIEVDDGREIGCTPDHKIFVLFGDVCEKRADELEVGDDVLEAVKEKENPNVVCR